MYLVQNMAHGFLLRFVFIALYTHVGGSHRFKTMDFLKSAVASAIAKGPAFGYSFGDKVELPQSIWTLYNGTKKVGITCDYMTLDISDLSGI